MPEKDCIESEDCIRCRLEMERQSELARVDMGRRIGDLEKDMCTLLKPEVGALASIHEKINKRPTWVVFWSLFGVLFFLITGAYAYINTISKEVIENRIMIRSEMVTKKDFREFQEELEKKIQKMVDQRG